MADLPSILMEPGTKYSDAVLVYAVWVERVLA